MSRAERIVDALLANLNSVGSPVDCPLVRDVWVAIVQRELTQIIHATECSCDSCTRDQREQEQED